MTNNEIVFPILELTDWVFEGEKVLDVQYDWSKIHYIKENDFEKQYQRILVDSQGQILKVTGRKIIGKKGYLLSFIIPVTLIVEFELELTGREMTLDEVKRNIIFKSKIELCIRRELMLAVVMLQQMTEMMRSW